MHRTTIICTMNSLPWHRESRRTLCFFPVVSPPNAPRLTNLDTRPCSSSHTKGSLSQNLGGWLPPPAKWYLGFVFRMTSFKGGAPIEDNWGSGREENSVIDVGQTLVRSTSTSCDEVETDWMEAREE